MNPERARATIAAAHDRARNRVVAERRNPRAHPADVQWYAGQVDAYDRCLRILDEVEPAERVAWETPTVDSHDAPSATFDPAVFVENNRRRARLDGWSAPSATPDVEAVIAGAIRTAVDTANARREDEVRNEIRLAVEAVILPNLPASGPYVADAIVEGLTVVARLAFAPRYVVTPGPT